MFDKIQHGSLINKFLQISYLLFKYNLAYHLYSNLKKNSKILFHQ